MSVPACRRPDLFHLVQREPGRLYSTREQAREDGVDALDLRVCSIRYKGTKNNDSPKADRTLPEQAMTKVRMSLSVDVCCEKYKLLLEIAFKGSTKVKRSLAGGPPWPSKAARPGAPRLARGSSGRGPPIQ